MLNSVGWLEFETERHCDSTTPGSIHGDHLLIIGLLPVDKMQSCGLLDRISRHSENHGLRFLTVYECPSYPYSLACIKLL